MSLKMSLPLKIALKSYCTALLVLSVCQNSNASSPLLNQEIGFFIDNVSSRTPNEFLYVYPVYWFYPANNVDIEDVAEALKPFFPHQYKETVAVYKAWKSPAVGIEISFYLSEKKFYIDFPVEYSLEKSEKLFLKAMAKLFAIETKDKKVIFPNNHFFKFEKIAHRRLKKSQSSTFSFDVIHSANEYLTHTSAMNLIIPDAHGQAEPIDQALRALKSGQFDWIALEMYPVQYKSNPQELKAFIDFSWDSFHELTTGRSYMEIINLAKRLNIQVIPLEDKFYYESGSPHRIDRLGMATRNQFWSNNTPKTGNGIIFGGLAHFAFRQNINYQDFISPSKGKTYFFYDWGLFDVLSFAESGEGFSINKLTRFRKATCARIFL